MRRPSAALIISCLALVGAWGGPAVAAKLITSKDVKDRSLSGRDLRSNTITGRNVTRLSGRDLLSDSVDGTDIIESSLGQVPRAREAARADQADRADSAERATSADRAATADALTGARIARVHFARAASTEAQALDLGGLRLRVRCSGSSAMTVTASTVAGPAWIRVTGSSQRSAEQTDPIFERDDDFRTGDEFNVLPGGADNSAGQIVYLAPEGSAVTVSFIAEQGVAAARGYACLFAGTAVQAAP